MSFDEYGLYGSDMPPLPNDEAERLAFAAQKGDLRARHDLVLSCMGIVYSLASKTRMNVPLDDRIGYGVLGLIHAIDKFKSKPNGRTFSSFVYPHVLRSIWLSASKHSWCVTFSEMPFWWAKRILREIGKAEARLEILSISEAAIAVKVPSEHMRAACSAAESMSRQMAGEFSFSIVRARESEVDKDADWSIVRNAIDELDEIDRYVLVMRHGLNGDDPKQLKEIAASINVPYQRCQKHYYRAINRLRVKLGPAMRDMAI